MQNRENIISWWGVAFTNQEHAILTFCEHRGNHPLAHYHNHTTTKDLFKHPPSFKRFSAVSRDILPWNQLTLSSLFIVNKKELVWKVNWKLVQQVSQMTKSFHPTFIPHHGIQTVTVDFIASPHNLTLQNTWYD